MPAVAVRRRGLPVALLSLFPLFVFHGLCGLAKVVVPAVHITDFVDVRLDGVLQLEADGATQGRQVPETQV